MLNNHIHGDGDKIPLDNYIRRLMNEKVLTIETMIPFTTSIRLDQIQNSTIQEAELNHRAITTSQALCSLMRRDLSYIKNPKDIYIQACKYIQILEDHKSRKEKAEIKEDIMHIISKGHLENRFLKYKYEPRLLNETMNAQVDEIRNESATTF